MNISLFVNFLGLVALCDTGFEGPNLLAGMQSVRQCESRIATDFYRPPKNSIFPQAEFLKHRRLKLQSNQTLTQVLAPFELDNSDIYQISQSMSPYIKPKNLQAGQNIDIEYRGRHLVSLSLNYEFDRRLALIRENNLWKALNIQLKLKTESKTHQGEIVGSLYQSMMQVDGDKNTVPLATFHQYVTLMSHFFDFQRDIKKGDGFALVYNTQSLMSDPKSTKAGVIDFAELKTRNESIRLYRYEINGEENYYDEAGNLVGSFLIKTPVKGGVLSSFYGLRKHPVLGYTRIHKGLDFSAPVGTPVIAAGKGEVIEARWSNSFGNFVKIQHDYGYQTLYAHLDKIDSKIKKGRRLRQGQVIGTLGSTGLTAGRHLHYEIHKNGRAIDPTSIKQKFQVTLSKKELKKFKKHIESYKAKF